MSAPNGCNDDTAVVESFKEALKQRIGEDRFRMWFSRGIEFACDAPLAANSPVSAGLPLRTESTGEAESQHADADGLPTEPGLRTRGCVVVRVSGPFAADRIRSNFMRELRGAAMHATGSSSDVRIELSQASESNQSKSPERSAETSPVPTANAPVGETARPPRPRQPRPGQRPSQHYGSRRSAESLSSLLTGSLAHPAATASPAAAPATAATSEPSSATRPDGTGQSAKRTGSARRAGPAKATTSAKTASAARSPKPTEIPGQSNTAPTTPQADASSKSTMTMASFVAGDCNQLAYTAARMACESPGQASPLCLFGPTGAGKTHLLAGLADVLRRKHRMKRVIHLSAEQFTNDFINSVGSSGLPAFRRRYRDVDALLIDDVQFLAAKKATLREMLYTVETLTAANRPLIFSANQSPTEIPGLSRELAGRMSAGLVCPLQPLDAVTRETLLRRAIDQRCPLPWSEDMITQLSAMLGGDGRVVSGLVNLVGTLQRMYRRMPTLDEIQQFGGDMLRSQTPTVSLTTIERAVCETFGLDDHVLRAGVQTRSVTEPRMLAMYLSRQLTPAAYAEIARHFGGRSHSTAIAASKKVASWLENGKAIGRGPKAMPARQALDRIESILRAG